MNKLKLVYEGQVLAKKNSKQIIINRRTGKPQIISNDKARFQEIAMENQFRTQATAAGWQFYYINHNNHRKRERAYPERFAIEITIYEQDKRRRDLDNQATAILDGLVEAQVIPDDSTEWLTSVKTTFGGIDKANPRAEIIIEKVFEDKKITVS